jgi:pyrroloquinoline quinone (PQQ) biosynthesis protein C
LALEDEALAHPAMRHPWLGAMAKRGYGAMTWAIRDFARQYHAYSEAFPLYLRQVIGKLESPTHRAVLQENLREEQGHLGPDDRSKLRRAGMDPDSVDGISHPQLYRCFCRSLGLGESELKRPLPAAERWRDDLLDFLAHASAPAALGALGPGTENVVKPVYRTLLNALHALPESERIDLRFFELHCLLDDQHAEDLRGVAEALLASPSDRRELRAGMLRALELRERFFTHLHRRASAAAPDIAA